MTVQRQTVTISLLPADRELMEILQDDRKTRTATKVVRAALIELAKARGLTIAKLPTEETKQL